MRNEVIIITMKCNTMTTADTIVMIVMTVEYEESTNQILGHPRLFLNINQKKYCRCHCRWAQ